MICLRTLTSCDASGARVRQARPLFMSQPPFIPYANTNAALVAMTTAASRVGVSARNRRPATPAVFMGAFGCAPADQRRPRLI